jgi:hypothetical protein
VEKIFWHHLIFFAIEKAHKTGLQVPLIDQQILKLGGIAIKGIEIDFAENTIHVALLAVLPKMPGTVNAGLFFLQVMGHP